MKTRIIFLGLLAALAPTTLLADYQFRACVKTTPGTVVVNPDATDAEGNDFFAALRCRRKPVEAFQYGRRRICEGDVLKGRDYYGGRYRCRVKAVGLVLVIEVPV